MMSSFSLVFANGSMPVYSSTPTSSNLINSGVYTERVSDERYASFASNADDCDYFIATINNSRTFCFLSQSHKTNLTVWQNIGSTVSTVNSSYYGDRSYGYAVFNDNNVVYSTFPEIGSFANYKAAFDYVVANGIVYNNYPSSVVGDGYLTNGLPVGNVIYFDLGSSGVEYDITLKSYFTSKSSWFGDTWVNDNRRYGFTDALPTTATNFDESSGSSIPWSPSGSTDLLGRSAEASATLSGTSTGRYLWILNPLYNLGYYDEPDKGTSLNGNIFYIGGISVDTPYYIYSLKQSATSLGLSSDVASSVGGVGSVTTSGAINTVVNDGSGTEYVPSVGGDNSAPQEVSATEGIKQTLDQFVQMFLNIFTAPISHIQQLISAGSEFIQHISGLWSWLPSEVSGFVASAFVVMVAISIFKLFL